MTAPLGVERVADACIVPVAGSRRGGAFDRTGQWIPVSGLKRYRGGKIFEYISEPQYQDPVRRMPGEYIFAGYMLLDWGHFILESCARLWYAKQRPELPLLWQVVPPRRPYQTDLLDALGLRNRQIFVRQPVAVDVLHVPEPGYRIATFIHPEYVRLMGVVTPKPDRAARVWLSRSRLADNAGRILEEESLEHRLRGDGWTVFHPQEHSVGEQLDMLARADTVAGFSGSAFHTLLLLEQSPRDVIVFPRGGLHQNYTTIAEGKPLNQTVVALPMRHVAGAATRRQFSLDDETMLLSALGVTAGVV